MAVFGNDEKNQIVEAMIWFAKCNPDLTTRQLVDELMEAAATGVSYALADHESQS